MKKSIKVLIIILLSIISLNVIYAEENNGLVETKTVLYNDGSARKDMPNMGINKKITITDSNRDNILRTPYVDASLKIYDFSNVLRESDKSSIKYNIDNFIERTNMDFAFVTIDMPYYNDSTNEEYAADFYDYNDFGLNYENYSGIIFVRNTYSKDPYYTLLVFGNAQLYYSQERIDIILDNIYDNIHNNKYNLALQTIINRLSSYYDKGKVSDNYKTDENGVLVKDKGSFKPNIGGLILIPGVITLIVLLVLIKKNKMVKKAINARDYINDSATNFKVRTDRFINTFTTRNRVQSNSSSGMHSSIGSSGRGHVGGGRHG